MRCCRHHSAPTGSETFQKHIGYAVQGLHTVKLTLQSPKWLAINKRILYIDFFWLGLAVIETSATSFDELASGAKQAPNSREDRPICEKPGSVQITLFEQ